MNIQIVNDDKKNDDGKVKKQGQREKKGKKRSKIASKKDESKC